MVRKWSLRPVAVPSLLVAGLAIAGYGFLDQSTPLMWIETLLLVQGLTVGMVMGPVTGALLSTLPLEKSGAGSAITNAVRQAGSVIGIVVGGTIMSIAYRSEIRPSLVGRKTCGTRRDIRRTGPVCRRHERTYGAAGRRRHRVRARNALRCHLDSCRHVQRRIPPGIRFAPNSKAADPAR